MQVSKPKTGEKGVCVEGGLTGMRGVFPPRRGTPVWYPEHSGNGVPAEG